MKKKLLKWPSVVSSKILKLKKNWTSSLKSISEVLIDWLKPARLNSNVETFTMAQTKKTFKNNLVERLTIISQVTL